MPPTFVGDGIGAALCGRLSNLSFVIPIQSNYKNSSIKKISVYLGDLHINPK
jgi:hypothetical protein